MEDTEQHCLCKSLRFALVTLLVNLPELRRRIAAPTRIRRNLKQRRSLRLFIDSSPDEQRKVGSWDVTTHPALDAPTKQCHGRSADVPGAIRCAENVICRPFAEFSRLGPTLTLPADSQCERGGRTNGRIGLIPEVHDCDETPLHWRLGT
jgi:hypothetical protein